MHFYIIARIQDRRRHPWWRAHSRWQSHWRRSTSVRTRTALTARPTTRTSRDTPGYTQARNRSLVYSVARRSIDRTSWRDTNGSTTAQSPTSVPCVSWNRCYFIVVLCLRCRTFPSSGGCRNSFGCPSSALHCQLRYIRSSIFSPNFLHMPTWCSMEMTGVYLGGIPLSRAPQIFRRNTRFALTGIRPDYQFLLLIFGAIWGSDFRDNLITLTRLFKQAKQIRIPFMTMFKVNTCPPNEVH